MPSPLHRGLVKWSEDNCDFLKGCLVFAVTCCLPLLMRSWLFNPPLDARPQFAKGAVLFGGRLVSFGCLRRCCDSFLEGDAGHLEPAAQAKRFKVLDLRVQLLWLIVLVV